MCLRTITVVVISHHEGGELKLRVFMRTEHLSKCTYWCLHQLLQLQGTIVNSLIDVHSTFVDIDTKFTVGWVYYKHCGVCICDLCNGV